MFINQIIKGTFVFYHIETFTIVVKVKNKTWKSTIRLTMSWPQSINKITQGTACLDCFGQRQRCVGLDLLWFSLPQKYRVGRGAYVQGICCYSHRQVRWEDFNRSWHRGERRSRRWRNPLADVINLTLCTFWQQLRQRRYFFCFGLLLDGAVAFCCWTVGWPHWRKWAGARDLVAIDIQVDPHILWHVYCCLETESIGSDVNLPLKVGHLNVHHKPKRGWGITLLYRLMYELKVSGVCSVVCRPVQDDA